MQFFIFCFIYFGCVSAKLDTMWWRHTAIYEVLVFTFKDSNNDGIGDIKGITSELDHFVDLGIETLYFTPFYKTAMLDMGYDITDYNDVDPIFGTLADFEELIREMKSRGLKLMMDLVINHTSDKHPWFLKSLDKIDPYTDYYIWKDPFYTPYSTDPNPPNKWDTCIGGSAWNWNDKRNQFYYHAFMNEQVDLDLRNENVKKELKNMMTFWLDKGVSGFRLDAPMFYIEDKYLRPRGQKDQKESFEFMHEIRLFLDKYNQEHGGPERIFSAEARSNPEIAAKYYGTKNYPITHFPFNYHFSTNMLRQNAIEMNHVIISWLSYVPPGEVAAWVSQDHDGKRIGTRIGQEFMDINMIITSMLPGIVHYYYGAEIGLSDGYIKRDQIRDLLGDGSRDPNRLVMQWDASINSGFSRNLKSFLPSALDYTRRNVQIQKNKEISHYNLMKNLNRLRKTKTIRVGKFISKVYSTHVFLFWRSLPGYETYIVLCNLNDNNFEVNFKRVFKNLPKSIFVEAASVNSGYKTGQIITFDKSCKFIMKPLSAVVLNGVEDLRPGNYV